MKVVLVEPNERARIAEINEGLEAFQKMVGGYIEALMPFKDPVALICNEEGKLNGLPLNRALRYNGEVRDIIAGTFFVVGAPPDGEAFVGLTDELAEKYLAVYREPEIFF